EEQLALVLVEFAWNINRSADAAAHGSEPVKRLGQAVPVVEEIIGIELLMALVAINAAVKILRAGLAHDLDSRAHVAAILRRVIVGDHLYLGDGSHADRRCE